MPEVQQICDRIVVINEGNIVANEKTEDLIMAVSGPYKQIAKICGPEADVIKVIKGIYGVKIVEVLGKRDTDSISYYIECEERVDIRKLLFTALSKAVYPLIGLEGVEASLEDIFINLTKSSNSSADSSAKQNKTSKKGE